MDSKDRNQGWNIDARTFEPKLISEGEPEENCKPLESDQRSNSSDAAQLSKSHDNRFMALYLNNAQGSEFLAQFNNMALSQQLDMNQYMYMQSLQGGMLSNPTYQNQVMTNRLPGVNKPLTAGTPSNQYLNPFLTFNRMNQSPLLSVPYMMPQSVPNVTNAAGRSRRNSCMATKVFNTGDPDIDKRLADSYKLINPRTDFKRDMSNSRFFVIKSYTEDHVHRSIKYGEWCSTQRGNDILDKAYYVAQSQGGHIFLFFSVNSSGYFCGVAEMTSACDSGRRSSHWNDDKWQGGFMVEWLYVKDVPNKYLKHIILEYNDNRPITNSRDATEIKPAQKGHETLRLMHEYHHNSSLFDDFEFYESRERECLTNTQRFMTQ